MNVRDLIAGGPKFRSLSGVNCVACGVRGTKPGYVDDETGLCTECWRAWRFGPCVPAPTVAVHPNFELTPALAGDLLAAHSRRPEHALWGPEWAELVRVATVVASRRGPTEQG